MLIFQEHYLNFEFTPISTAVYSESVYAWGMMERFFFPCCWHDPVAAQLWTWSTFSKCCLLKLLVPVTAGLLLLSSPWHEPVSTQFCTFSTVPNDWPSNCLASLTGLPADLQKKNSLESRYSKACNKHEVFLILFDKKNFDYMPY